MNFVTSESAQEQDAADLLYKHGLGSALVSVLASSGLASITVRQLPSSWLRFWWLSMTAVLLFRAADVFWYRFRLRCKPAHEIRRFSIGVIAAATLWATFPLLFFPLLDQAGRAYTTILLCGMAGGSATVLSPSRGLSSIFSSLLVLPAALRFLFLPGEANTFLGILGCAFLVVLVVSSGIAHDATMKAVRLNCANEALVVQLRKANNELQGAQNALRASNQALEFRILARTAALDLEIRKKEQYAEELAHLASTDLLTGLSNRGSFIKRLTELLAEPQRTGTFISVLFVDLDRFKETNDALGHAAGDTVLRQIANRLADSLPTSVQLARWGGDEFVLTVCGLESVSQISAFASQLIANLGDPIEIDDQFVTIDGTVGVAVFPEHGTTADELIRSADIAMYAGKAERLSRVRVFEPSLDRRRVKTALLQ